MTHQESTKLPSAKESVESDENSLLSSGSADDVGVIHPHHHHHHDFFPVNDVDDKPPLGVQPLHPIPSPSPMGSSAKASTNSAASARKKKKKKKGKNKVKGNKPPGKKHRKSQKASALSSGPSTSKKHRKSLSIISRMKVYPVPLDEEPGSSKTEAAVEGRIRIGGSSKSTTTTTTAAAAAAVVATTTTPTADETENAIALAVREIRRYRERIAELEEHVRVLCESYGIDPESLLTPESMGASAGSSTVLRKGARGIRVSVEGTTHTRSSSRQDLTVSDSMEDLSQQLTTPSMSVLSPSRPEVPITPIQAQLSEEQKMSNIMHKLQKLTGRKTSLEEISPLLRARNPDEAMRNGRLLRTAEHLKRVYGGRPEGYVCVVASPSPPPLSAPLKKQFPQHQPQPPQQHRPLLQKRKLLHPV